MLDSTTSKLGAGAGRSSGRRTDALRDDRLAHDLKNLMTVIVSATEMLAQNEDGREERREAALAGLQAARLGAGLVQQLLAERGQPVAARPSSECAATLETASRLAARVVAPGVEIKVQRPARALRCRAGQDELATALLNLCKNAAEACGERGEVILSAAPMTAAAAQAAGLAPRRHVRFEVRDNGSGMSPEVLSRATRPYFTTKASAGGQGLGLPSVAEFARAEGGALRIRSTAGAGTAVSLFLPRSGLSCASAYGEA